MESINWVNILAVPFFVLLGVIAKGIYDTAAAKMSSKVQSKQVQVSEKEAETHQWQAIVDGFTASLAAVNVRAEGAEREARDAKAEAAVSSGKINLLDQRVNALEGERREMLNHIIALEHLVPYPPGPPKRPVWK